MLEIQRGRAPLPPVLAILLLRRPDDRYHRDDVCDRDHACRCRSEAEARKFADTYLPGAHYEGLVDVLTAAARTLRWTPDLVERNDLKIALGEFGGIWSEEVRPDDDIMGKIHSALDEVMLIDPGFIRGPLLDAANEVIADANARTLAG